MFALKTVIFGNQLCSEATTPCATRCRQTLNRWKTQFRASSQILLVSWHELLSHRPRQLDLLRGNPTRGSDEISVIFPSAATTLGQEQRSNSHPKYPHPNSPDCAGGAGAGRSSTRRTHRRRQRLPSPPGRLAVGLRAVPGARAAPMEHPARHDLSRHPQLPLRCDSDSSPQRYTDIPFIFLIFQIDNPQLALPAPRQIPAPSPAPGTVSGWLAAYLCRCSWRAEGPHPPPRSAPLRSAVTAPPRAVPGPSPPAAGQAARLRPAARCPHPLNGPDAAGTLGSVGSPTDYIPLRALLLLRAALLQLFPPPRSHLLLCAPRVRLSSASSRPAGARLVRSPKQVGAQVL